MSDENLNIVHWTLHDTHPELVEHVRAKLSEVIDPEIGMNIIQLGLIRNVELDGDVARLKMILTTPFCPYGPAMVDMTRQKAQEALKKPVTVEMGMEVWDFSMMEDPTAMDWGLYS